MRYKIGEKCVKCGSCFASCPVGAIIEKDDGYEIDLEICVDCGNCACICPMEAVEENK